MNKVQGTIVEDDIKDRLKAFMFDRKIRHVSSGSIRFYQQKLEPFVSWCDQRGLNGVLQINTHQLRLFLVSLEEDGHNPGGRLSLHLPVWTNRGQLRFRAAIPQQAIHQPLQSIGQNPSLGSCELW